jgi:hypothetical protein
MSVFKNRVPRKIFGPKSEKITGDWRKLCIDKLRDFYCLCFVQMLQCRNRERRNAYRSLVRRHEGKELHEKSWLRWKDNIKGSIK